MKKKKLVGKLNLNKSKISNVGSDGVKGGLGIQTVTCPPTQNPSYCGSNCQEECVTFPGNGCGPSNGICTGEYCDTNNSYCKCL